MTGISESGGGGERGGFCAFFRDSVCVRACVCLKERDRELPKRADMDAIITKPWKKITWGWIFWAPPVIAKSLHFQSCFKTPGTAFKSLHLRYQTNLSFLRDNTLVPTPASRLKRRILKNNAHFLQDVEAFHVLLAQCTQRQQWSDGGRVTPSGAMSSPACWVVLCSDVWRTPQ